jgi:hypothetical protein
VPREAAARGREIAPQGARGEDGEGDEQRRGLAADEQQPAARDGRVALGRAELLRRHGQRPGGRLRLERRPGRIRAVDELVDLPEPGRPAAERLDPGVRAVGAGEHRRRHEPVDALRDDERRGRRPVVLRGVAQRRGDLGVGERVVGRREEVAEQQT